MRLISFVLLALLPVCANAVELTLPASARQTAGQDLGVDSYALPIANFDGAEIPARKFEGFITRQAWRIEGGGVTPLQLLQPLRDELKSSGFTLLFECADRVCGGFDFRFGTDVINAPDMYVNLDDFRFISAVEGDVDAPKTAISLLISRSAAASYIQVIQVAVDQRNAINVSKGDEILASTQVGETVPVLQGFQSVSKQLDVGGHVILNDLEFKTGSSQLGEGPFASLGNLAAYLSSNGERKIALVGHTDAEGSLEGNIALSKRRAASVRTRLIEEHGVLASQLSAEGVGYLSPIASNLTVAGRDANRRVEAVVISTN
ncbi:OmpA family protein [Planktotalea sp.]|uniref:OmpA family protein n=1 Tax=Planktotalea sp. TaxID=2029877 RepID=UPI00329A2D90